MVRYINERNVVDAADHVGADTMPNDIEMVSPAAPRVKRSKFSRNLGKLGSGIYGLTVGPAASLGKSVYKGGSKDFRRMGKAFTRGGKVAAQGSKLRSRAWDMKAKADDRYNTAIGKSNATWGKGIRKSVSGRIKQILSPILSEQELLEYGITNYDLDNYDYFLVEKKTKKSRFGAKAGKALGSAVDKGVDFVNTTGDTVNDLGSDAVKGGRKVAKVVVRKAKKEYRDTKRVAKKAYRETTRNAKANLRAAKRNVKNFGKSVAKDLKNMEKAVNNASDSVHDFVDDSRKVVGRNVQGIGKALSGKSGARSRQLSGLSKEDKAKASEGRKALAATRKARKENSRTVKSAERERQSELSESVLAELGALYNSINMIPLVESIMNGEPASTQDIFGDIMNDKLAAAIELYRDASANDLFNEPSEFDDEDYEDGFEDAEVIAEWTEYDPEDEDDEEEFEFDEDDFEEEDEE